MKDVPIAITAVSGQQLQKAGIDGSTQLGLVTPGLNFAVQGAFAEPTIRGIGTSVTGAGADANVSLYIDGVYQPSQTANLFDFNNIQRIEVLKGPQGTLFGRNATGGAIMITTLDPSFKPSADVAVSYGSYNEVKVDGYATGGLAPNLAGDVALQYRHDDGYVRNVTTGDEIANASTISVRSKLLYQPSNALSFVLSGNYADVQDNSPFAVKPIGGNNAFADQVSFPTDPYQVALTNNPQIKTKSYGVDLHAKYSTDFGTISSITSYERIEPYLSVDIDNSPIFASGAIITSPETTVTQELNFASKDIGRFSWVGGLYFYWDDTRSNLVVTSGAVPPPYVAADIVGRVRTDAEAVFAEGNYDLTDRIRLIAGVRYSSERKQADVDLAGVPGTAWQDSRRWDSATPRASIRFKLNETSDVYATFSEGFKSGNYNVGAVYFSPIKPVNPETVDAYEIGYKFADRSVSFNASAYYYDYKNIQVQIQQNVNGQLSTLLQNAATATIYGMDADFQARLNQNWRVDAGAAWTHARYDQYPNAVVYVPNVQVVNGQSYVLGNTIDPSLNGDGKDMIRTPEFTANLTATYDRPLTTGSVEADATVSYNSGFYWDPGNLAKQDAYTIVNATVSWLSDDKSWRLSVWGKNLANERYYFYSNQTSTGTSGAIARPITGGVTIAKRFN